MLLASHAAVGGIAGEYLNSPGLAFFAGFIIHFILDAIPHYDTTDEKKWTKRQYFLMFVDIAVGIILLILFYDKIGHPVSFILGAFGGIVPDIMDNTPFWNKKFRASWFGKRFHLVHEKIQWAQPGPILGLTVQGLILTISVLILALK